MGFQNQGRLGFNQALALQEVAYKPAAQHFKSCVLERNSEKSESTLQNFLLRGKFRAQGLDTRNWDLAAEVGSVGRQDALVHSCQDPIQDTLRLSGP